MQLKNKEQYESRTFTSTEEHEEAFNAPKNALTSPLLLTHFRDSLVTVVMCGVNRSRGSDMSVPGGWYFTTRSLRQQNSEQYGGSLASVGTRASQRSFCGKTLSIIDAWKSFCHLKRSYSTYYNNIHLTELLQRQESRDPFE